MAELYSLVAAAGIADSLDALTVLSALLPNKNSAARDLVAIMGECCSAKEVVMATQEQIEKVVEHAGDEEEGEDEGDHSEATSVEKSSWAERLVELVDLYRAAIPRLKLRKRSASETLQPLLSDLQPAMDAVSYQANSLQSRDLMTSVERMVNRVLKWVKDLPAIEPEEVAKCQFALKPVLDHALVLFKYSLQCDSAQKALELCFPRLKMGRQAASSSEGQGSSVLEMYKSTYGDMGFTSSQHVSSPSLVSVILLVHAWLAPSTPTLTSIPSSFLPSLLAMLQSNSNLHDDALAFLLLILHQNQSAKKTELSPDITNAFIPLLVALSSAHPTPSVRHQAFRVMSLLLARSLAQLRLQILADLVANCEYPQMRVAAVGLVKDAVLDALNSKSTGDTNPFGTPMFMRVFGPLLFRPSPSDLFDQRVKLDLEEFLESPEPKRITEVLSLYYVILLRDQANTTGIRDKDMLGTVNKNLMDPLGSWLGSVMDKEERDHAIMPLASLQMGLKRVQDAQANF